MDCHNKTLSDAICFNCKNWKWSTEHASQCSYRKSSGFGESIEVWFPPDGDIRWSAKPMFLTIKLPAVTRQ